MMSTTQNLYKLLLAGALAVTLPAATLAAEASTATAPAPALSSKVLEKELQSLDWEQFQSVVKAVPKLRAQVDAYGPMGWQFVQQNYRSYGWRKSIDKLDVDQKQDLQDLINKQRGARE